MTMKAMKAMVIEVGRLYCDGDGDLEKLLTPYTW